MMVPPSPFFKIRTQVCQDALEDMFAWMDVDGEVCFTDEMHDILHV